MADLTEIQASGSTKVTGASSGGTESNYLDVDSNGNAKTKIHGATDNTAIGNVGDRLKVASDIPTGNIIHQTVFLANGGSISAAVNGSSTAQTFSYTAPAGQTWYVSGFRFSLADIGVDARDEFGGIGGLSNGVLVRATISSTDYTIATLVNNFQLRTQFKIEFRNDASGSFGNNNDSGTFYRPFDPPITLAPADSFSAVVRDNLTGLNQFYLAIDLWRTI